MQRLINAFFNSISAFRHLLAHEKAFQQEIAVLIVGIVLSFFVTSESALRFALIGSLILVLIVEVLNTGIEATCNALSREFHADIKIAKDAGSLAVLLSILLAVAIWGWAIWQWFFG